MFSDSKVKTYRRYAKSAYTREEKKTHTESTMYLHQHLVVRLRIQFQTNKLRNFSSTRGIKLIFHVVPTECIKFELTRARLMRGSRQGETDVTRMKDFFAVVPLLSTTYHLVENLAVLNAVHNSNIN